MLIKPPLVSIITPVYNGADYIEDLILSIQHQDYPAIEHLIIDDGSDDHNATWSILERYPHLRCWKRENRGQYATMNEGLREAHGDWVCFISADDLMAESAVSAAMQAATAHPGCGVVYGKTYFRHSAAGSPESPFPIRHVTPGLFPYTLGISHCAMYVNRQALISNQLFFNQELRYSGDYEWSLHLIRTGLRFIFVDRKLATVRIHPQQASILYEQAAVKERHFIQKRCAVRRFLFDGIQFVFRIHSAGKKAWTAFRSAGPGGVWQSFQRWYRRKKRI